MRAGKRGGGQTALSLDDVDVMSPTTEKELDVLALDDALKTLAQMDERKAKVVELRFFAGLNFDETAEVLQVSAVTIARDWSTAKAWLHREMTRGPSTGSSNNDSSENDSSKNDSSKNGSSHGS